jgi:hypothetical protein
VITNVSTIGRAVSELFSFPLPDLQDYVRQMIRVFNDAEDMESLDDLHSLCTMMSTIREYLPFNIRSEINAETSLDSITQRQRSLRVSTARRRVPWNGWYNGM